MQYLVVGACGMKSNEQEREAGTGFCWKHRALDDRQIKCHPPPHLFDLTAICASLQVDLPLLNCSIVAEMSENIPESIPTSADRRSNRPVKRARGPATAVAAQSTALEHLFAQPDKEIFIPAAATKAARVAGDMAPPPEIVANVQGSSAGAGSGEFHVYKASRRREFERIRLMEEEAKKEEADKEWAAKQEERRKKDEEGRSRNAKRREKAKARKKSQMGSTEIYDTKVNGRSGGKNGHVGDDRPEQDDEQQESINDVPVAPEENGIVIHDDD